MLVEDHLRPAAVKAGVLSSSWGGALVSFIPERCDGMIYGISGNGAILLSLFDPQPPSDIK